MWRQPIMPSSSPPFFLHLNRLIKLPPLLIPLCSSYLPLVLPLQLVVIYVHIVEHFFFFSFGVLGNNFLFVHLLVYAAVAEEMDVLGGV